MLIDAIRPSSKVNRFAFDAFCIAVASFLLALLSQVELKLWFTPVPITLQTLGVMLIAATLGSKRGVLALLVYLGEGALGFPVFAGGGSGLVVLAGPTAGYLASFVFAAWIMGWLLEKGSQENLLKNFLILSFGSLIMLVIGTLWLSWFVGFRAAPTMGFYPFILGSALKSMIAALGIKAGKRFV